MDIDPHLEPRRGFDSEFFKTLVAEMGTVIRLVPASEWTLYGANQDRRDEKLVGLDMLYKRSGDSTSHAASLMTFNPELPGSHQSHMVDFFGNTGLVGRPLWEADEDARQRVQEVVDYCESLSWTDLTIELDTQPLEGKSASGNGWCAWYVEQKFSLILQGHALPGRLETLSSNAQ